MCSKCFSKFKIILLKTIHLFCVQGDGLNQSDCVKNEKCFWSLGDSNSCQLLDQSNEELCDSFTSQADCEQADGCLWGEELCYFQEGAGQVEVKLSWQNISQFLDKIDMSEINIIMPEGHFQIPESFPTSTDDLVASSFVEGAESAKEEGTEPTEAPPAAGGSEDDDIPSEWREWAGKVVISVLVNPGKSNEGLYDTNLRDVLFGVASEDPSRSEDPGFPETVTLSSRKD